MNARLCLTALATLFAQATAIASVQAPASAKPLPVAPALPARFTMTALDWAGLARSIRPIYHTSSTGGPLGFIDAGGVITLTLAAPPSEVLRPITEWNDYLGLGCMPDDLKELQTSDPKARFTMVYKLMSNNKRYDIYQQESSNADIAAEIIHHSPLVYVDRPVRIQASSECRGLMHLEADLNLPKGWTFIDQTLNHGGYQQSIVLQNPTSDVLKW